MKTKYKILIAKIIYKIISLFKYNKFVLCERSGIKWNLDLSEAIDLHIFIFGNFEPEINNVAQKLKLNNEKLILDIGANFGVQSLQFAKAFSNSKILSIEPTDFAFSKMKKNFDLNDKFSKNLFPYQIFIGSDNQNIPKSIYSSWNLDQSDIKHEKHFGSKKETNKASIITLDSFVKIHKISKVDFIKLDVDGFEFSVLKGGSNFLKNTKPPIFMELAPYLYNEHGYSKDELIKLILSFGYKFYELKKVNEIKDIFKFINNIKDGSSKNILLN